MAFEAKHIYYPRARVRLSIRFDDFGKVHPPPQKPRTLRNGKGKLDNKDKLRVVQQGGKLVLQADALGQPTFSSPQAASKSNDTYTYSIDGIVPVRASLQRNNIRTADQLTLELRFIHFPFDPRALRAVGVEYFLGTIDYQAFMDSRRDWKRAEIPDSYIDGNGRLRSNLRFQGWVDEIHTAFPKGAGTTVTLECTDNTRILIEAESAPKLTIDPAVPLDRGIADYLSNYPQFRGLAVEYRPAGEDPPIPKAALAKTAYTPKLGPAAGGGTSKLTVWDYMTDFVGQLGLTLRMQDSTIIIQRARTLYSGKFTGRPDDPFTERTLDDGRVIHNRLFIHGRNIDDVDFGRKYTKFDSLNIEVRCYVAKLKRTLVARFPVEKKDRNSKAQPGDQKDEKWLVIRVQGIEDEKTLRVVAQGAYEAIGRQELTVNFATKNLASFGGDNLDPDALDIQATDTVDVEFDRSSPNSSTIAGIEEEIANNASSYLTRLGYSAEISAAYERAMRDIGFPSTFRVRSVGIEYDFESGVAFDFECTNYMEARVDKELPPGEEIASKPTTVGKSTKQPVKK